LGDARRRGTALNLQWENLHMCYTHSRRAVLLIALLGAASLADAQSDPRAGSGPRAGVVLGSYGPGLLWHVSNGFAMRPDVHFAVSKTGGLESWSVGAGLSGLFYAAGHDNLRSYVGPRVGYSYAGNSSAYSANYSAGAFYGIQYAVVRRLDVFGEAVVSYYETRGNRTTSLGFSVPIEPTRSVSVGSGIGLVYYFR